MSVFKFPQKWLLLLCLFMPAPALLAQATLQIGQNFVGSDNTQTYITPADSDGAVGPGYFVEFINGAFAVYNKVTGQRVLRITDLDFWSEAGVTVPADSSVSDPRIIFDPVSGRWFAVQVDLNSTASDPTIYSNHYLLAVSDTADPSGTWHAFSFRADPTTGDFADFPTLGVDADAVYLAGDMYSGSNNAVGPSLTMIPKADLLASPPVITNRVFFGVLSYGQRGQILQPASCFDGTGAGNILAVGDLGYDLLAHSNLVATTVLDAGSTNATLAPSSNIAVDPYTVPLDPPQPDGTTTLADNDTRFSARVYTVNGITYAVHNVEVNGRAALRWYRIAATNDTLLESGTIADTNLDLIFPSIAANSNGVVVICCNGCSSNTFISAYAYAGLTIGGSTAFGNATLLAAGTTSYHDLNEQLGVSGESRWGDYSTTSVDPADPSRFWTIQLIPNSDGETWSTQITELITASQAPPLAISRSGTDVALSWPDWAGGFHLYSTTNLLPGSVWLAVTQAPATNNNQITLSLPASATQEFFRLQMP